MQTMKRGISRIVYREVPGSRRALRESKTLRRTADDPTGPMAPYEYAHRRVQRPQQQSHLAFAVDRPRLGRRSGVITAFPRRGHDHHLPFCLKRRGARHPRHPERGSAWGSFLREIRRKSENCPASDKLTSIHDQTYPTVTRCHGYSVTSAPFSPTRLVTPIPLMNAGSIRIDACALPRQGMQRWPLPLSLFSPLAWAAAMAA